MWDYATNLRGPSARAQSKAYSDVLKLQGIEFSTLISTHKNRLGYTDEFEFLEEDQKLEVYNSIIVESGRAKMPVLYRSRKSDIKKVGGIAATKSDIKKAAGNAAMAVSAGLMVWDIYTAEHKLEAALKNGVKKLSDEVASYLVRVSITSAVETVVAETEIATLLVSAAGFVVGTVVGLLFAAATGAILEAILGNGGKVPTNLDDLKFYAAKMPDGNAIAYEISHT
uniref:Uncharacterized protein n=1 Tax=Oliveria decumbens TaxID=2571315 RepID=A0A6C0TJ43_9APIA|nr:hypothetical protein [Oliveria decumbens]